MTPLTAATATTIPTTTVALLLALWAGWYLITSAIWPWTSCPRCHGSGTHRSPSRRAFRDCAHCAGRGRRLRLAHRLWQATTTRDDR
ncbi:MAG: hypothetical protein ACRDSN_13975 [Pseudonocardiaceae bacterium]